MVFNFELVGLFGALIWLLIITVFLWQMISHYNKLGEGLEEKTLKKALEQLLLKIEKTQEDIETLKNRCDTIEKDGLEHIQKFGLLRFNPFKDTGGNQSFILTLLDGKNTGVVISGLYSRVGTRWYAKQVREGKSTSHDLSEEEKKALEQTTKN